MRSPMLVLAAAAGALAAAALPAAELLPGPSRVLTPIIARYFGHLGLPLVEGRAARAFARELEDDDDAAWPRLRNAEDLLAVPGSSAADGSAAGGTATAGAVAAGGGTEESTVFGAGLGLGFRINEDASVSASYRLRKPYTGQSDIDYLKLKQGATKEDISLDFRYRF